MRGSTQLDPLPAPGPDGVIVLRPSRLKWSLLLLGSLAFCVPLGAIAVTESHVVAALVALLFGSGVIVSVFGTHPRRGLLRISPDGLRMRSAFRTRRYGWDEVGPFRALQVDHRGGSQELVGFDLEPLAAAAVRSGRASPATCRASTSGCRTPTDRR